ncbi:hypothetical protein CDAR_65831 [Caerostris darwini]|uniref:Uncharacterized protein n=1 Tax=Caerostris darwini TaxID=1538125 RepID=A0AAV4UC78_9ARAC|nr:hypothetical protein CDAR_65831 [Caerostris darwini]
MSHRFRGPHTHKTYSTLKCNSEKPGLTSQFGLRSVQSEFERIFGRVTISERSRISTDRPHRRMTDALSRARRRGVLRSPPIGGHPPAPSPPGVQSGRAALCSIDGGEGEVRQICICINILFGYISRNRKKKSSGWEKKKKVRLFS